MLIYQTTNEAGFTVITRRPLGGSSGTLRFTLRMQETAASVRLMKVLGVT